MAEITPNLSKLVDEILKTCPDIRSIQSLVKKVIELRPEWLSVPIYNPVNTYQIGQRLFHASLKLEEWFTIEDVMGDLLCVKFDNGKEMTLLHRGGKNIPYPINLGQYLALKLEKDNQVRVRVDNVAALVSRNNKIGELGGEIIRSSISKTKIGPPTIFAPSKPILNDKGRETDLALVCKKYDIHNLYYIVHINNLEGILT